MVHRIDLFAVFIFLGIVQAVFLCVFFFSKENRSNDANIFQGLVVLSGAACVLEIFFCYTGYILDALWLVDYSEWIAFLIGPSYYLMTYSLIHGKRSRYWYLHFIPSGIWFLFQIPFFVQDSVVKYNAWVGAYHPAGHDFKPTDASFIGPPYHTEIILLHLAIYGVFVVVMIGQTFYARSESFWKTKNPVLRKIRTIVFQLTFFTTLIFVVKLFNKDDTGDHLFAAYLSVPIYFISIQVIRQSVFFRQPTLGEATKYKSSTLTDDQQRALVLRITEQMTTNKPFLQASFSLPDLAAQLNVTVHVLSQAINDGLGKSFFEMTAEYRIAEARKLLIEKPHIKVEEIAEEVGYLSKSSFNTAFKKLTGKTPSEWRASPQGAEATR